jgi:hypothetical protein
VLCLSRALASCLRECGPGSPAEGRTTRPRKLRKVNNAMPFIPVPNVAMVELLYTQDDQKMENTLYFENENPWSAIGLTTLAEEIIAWWTTNIRPNVSNTVTFRGVKATSLESETAPAVEVPSGLAGGGTSPAMPNNVTAAIKFLTALRGRSFRGRNYIVGLMDEAVSQNDLSTITAGNYSNGYLELLDTSVITNGIWVVVSRFTNGDPRTTGVSEPVTGVTFTDFTVDSQRRRLPGRGA